MMHRLINDDTAEFWARLLKLDVAHHHRVRSLCRWAGYFVRRTLKNERGDGNALVLDGPTGTGKTTVGRFCARAFNDYILEALSAGLTKWRKSPLPSAAILNWSKFCRDMERQETGPWRLDEVLAADVIILDDVGAESDRFRSGGHKAELRDFLEECRNKWLMVSTNVPRKEWPEAFGQRVASRLDAARSVDTTGIPDYRISQGLKTITK